MIKSQEDLEGFLQRLERRFERLQDGTYLVTSGAGQPPVLVRLAPPVVLVQAEIGPVPSNNAALEARVFRSLLEFNARDLLHSAYGVNANKIVLSSALEIDNLDLNELEAVLADVDLALAKHVPTLRGMVQE